MTDKDRLRAKLHVHVSCDKCAKRDECFLRWFQESDDGLYTCEEYVREELK